MSDKIRTFAVQNQDTMKGLTLQQVFNDGEELFRCFRWGKTVYCPYCGSVHVYKGKGRYKCKDCNRRFTDKTGTLFHGSKLSLTTIMAALYLMMTDRGLSSYIMGTQLGISQRTSWCLQTKVRLTLSQKELKVGDDVAVDEWYACGSLKWKHLSDKLKLYEKYGIQVENNHPTQPQSLMLSRRRGVPVIGLHDGTTLVLQQVEAPVLSQSIIDTINAHNGGMTHLTCDESHLYFPLAKLWETTTMNHKKHIYGWDGYSSNRIENCFGHFNTDNVCHHRHQKDRYMQGYLNLFVFVRNNRKNTITDSFTKAFSFFNETHFTIKAMTA